MKNRLLIFANDPAGANVTMAYAVLNKHLYSTILAFATSSSIGIYKQHIAQYICDGSYKFETNDTIVTGTSGIDSTYELDIIKEAKKFKVKQTITIVDNIANFLMRFSINNKIVSDDYLPNEIWVFDNDFKSNHTLIDDRLIYKQNIYNTYIKELYNTNPPQIKNSFIKTYQYKYIVILSEYLFELYGLKYGHTEYDMVQTIFETINTTNQNIPIYLKLHPKEHKNKYNILLRKYSHLNICCDDISIQELIYHSKIVYGIASSVFLESYILNIPTYSIQINSKKDIYPKYIKKHHIIKEQKILQSIYDTKEAQDIYIRPICLDDANYDYPNWLNDPIVCKYNSHGDIFYTKELAMQYINSVQNSDHTKVFAICTKQHLHIGNISLQSISDTHQNAEFAIMMGNRSYMNKSYAKQASQLILKYGFDELNLQQIYCGTSELNTPMQHLALALGMIQNGISKNSINKNGKYLDAISYVINKPIS
jgi:RimJ/RimL family protein N-acetyltransferase